MQLPSTFAAVPGFLKANPLVLYGSLAGLAALGVIIWLVARKSSAAPAALSAPVAAAAPPSAAPGPAQIVLHQPANMPQLSVAQIAEIQQLGKQLMAQASVPPSQQVFTGGEWTSGVWSFQRVA